MAAILPAKAQDTPGDGPRTVVVEKEYDPEIGDADKIDLLPPAERKSAPATEAEYALTARPYTGKMELNTLGTGYSPTPPGKAPPPGVAGYDPDFRNPFAADDVEKAKQMII